MATFPYFILGPNTAISIAGFIHGPDRTDPTPAEDWRKATVNVIIPSLNEEVNIVFCLASLAKQTLKPQRVILVDDGSSDNTVEFARRFCKLNNIEIIIIQRKSPIGKTPTIKRQSREFEADVEFILDADTILASDNYIERTVEELYKSAGIACSCGIILPLRESDRVKAMQSSTLQNFCTSEKSFVCNITGFSFKKMSRYITIFYREILYFFLQKFIYRGQMVFLGTIMNPVGCAVAYRQKYIKSLFENYEPLIGDSLTDSEDVFIGFAMLNHGYRNIQLPDVYARTIEPDIRRLPHQIYLWSSSFLQSCYYFDSLVKSPFKSIRRRAYYRKQQKQYGKKSNENRIVKEPYRQAFGDEHTRKYGRPVGWMVFAAALEKTAFPVALLLMLFFRLWEPLLVTVGAEVLLSSIILAFIAPERKFKYFMKAVVVAPVRYATLFFDLFIMMRFAADIWISKDTKRWKK